MESQRELLDAPVAPRVEGVPGAHAWLEPLVDNFQESTSMRASTEESPGTPQVQMVLGAIASVEGRHIGFLGVDRVSATFSITCGNSGSQTVSGRLVTWSVITEGALT